MGITQDSIGDILSSILNGISENQSMDEIEKRLKKSNNYNLTVVAAAYSWIFDKILANLLNKTSEDGKAKKKRISKRFYSKEETDNIGIDNLNHMIKLKELGLLTHHDINRIVEGLSASPIEHLSKKELNLIILGMLFDGHQIVPPGSRTSLFLSDQVN